MKNTDLTLYLVTHRTGITKNAFFRVIEEAVKGGVRIVQLREKDTSIQEFMELGIELKELLKPYGIPLIINDLVDVALAVKADGIHLGQKDMKAENARELLGKNAIIGLSVESIEQALEAEKLPIDYIAASPVFSTSTKKDTEAPWGLEGLSQLRQISSHPIVAIGGIDANNVDLVRKAGADGIAVVSAIFDAEDPYQAAQILSKRIHR